jgi:hypothetical protein
MPLGGRLQLFAAMGFALGALCACDSSGAGKARPRSSSPTPTAPATPARSPAPTEPSAEQAPSNAPPALRAPAPTPQEPEPDDLPAEHSLFLVDDLNDVGPAAPATAFARGAVLIKRNDDLSVAELRQPPSKAKKPVASEIEPVRAAASDFWPVARGPAVSPSHAYWVSKGRVVRRALAGGDLEVLATDARDGTRVSVAGSPDAVAYITRPGEQADSRARLRLSDGRSFELTPDGAAASSVSLANWGDDLVVSFIDGRSGMTPVHARRFRAKAGSLDPDVVVWVAGATQGMTELRSVSHASTTWLLLPVERDARRFGLATLAIEGDPKMDPPLRWRTYENGLDRAPTAAAVVCGAATAAYVRPANEAPGSEQELVISALTLAETASSVVVATARGFAEVSLHAIAEGAVLSYVSDRRTWARLLRCK